MDFKKLAVLIALGFALAPVCQAQVQHVEMRVEGMT
jgi:hypothetical protein